MIHNSGGFSLVEVLLAVSIFGLIVTALIGGLLYGQESTALAGQRARAVLLADEGLEAARNIRDALFTNISPGTSGLAISSNQWTLSGSSDVSDIFTRQLQIAQIDSNRKRITSTVTWQQNPQRSGTASLVTYLTNWRRDNGKTVPSVPETTLDLPGSADGLEIDLYKTGGSTHAIVGRKSSSDKELYVVDVTNSSVPTIAGSLEIGSDVNGVVVIGSNAYLATTDNAAELQVVSLTTPSSPSLIGSLDLSGNADGLTIAGSGTTVFIGIAGSSDAEIYSISISTPSSPSVLSSLEVGDSVWKVTLAQSNAYLYAATGSDTEEFLAVSVSNPSSISQTGSIDITGTSDATSIVAFSTFAGIGRSNGDFYTIDVTTPSVPTLLSSALAIGTQVNDLIMGPGDAYIFAADSTVNKEITVIDVATPPTPSIFTTVSLGNNMTGVIWDLGPNKIYATATSNASEFVVIKAP